MLPRVDSPTFEFTVPSTKEKVKMRMMKVRDEKVLLMAKEGGDPTEILSAIKQVVNNCIVADDDVTVPGLKSASGKEVKTLNRPNIDSDWAIFDIEYAFLQLRAHSVSDIAEVSYIDNDEVDSDVGGFDPKDPKYGDLLKKAQTKATRTFKIDLKDVKVRFPEKVESQIKINNKVGIHLRYPPASLYSDKEFLKATGDDLVNTLISKSIETVYDGNVISFDKTHPAQPGELKEFIENLDVKVYNKLKEFFNNLPSLYYSIEYTNANGKERKIELTTLSDFFTL